MALPWPSTGAVSHTVSHAPVGSSCFPAGHDGWWCQGQLVSACRLPTMVYLLYSRGRWSSSLFCDDAAQACDINQLIGQQYKQSRAEQIRAINHSFNQSTKQSISLGYCRRHGIRQSGQRQAGRTGQAGQTEPASRPPALPPKAFRPCFYSSLLGGPHLGPPDTLVSDPTPSPSPPSTQTWPQPTGNWHHNLRLECRACGAATC